MNHETAKQQHLPYNSVSSKKKFHINIQVKKVQENADKTLLFIEKKIKTNRMKKLAPIQKLVLLVSKDQSHFRTKRPPL